MDNAQFSRGPYCMRELKGYSKYFRFTTAEYNLRWVPEDKQRWAIDTNLHQNHQYDERYKAYQEALLSLLRYDEEYDNSTPLDLIEKARALKQHYFPEWWEDALRTSYQSLEVDTNRLADGTNCDFLLPTPYPSQEGNSPPGRGKGWVSKTSIDDDAKYIRYSWPQRIKINALFPQKLGKTTIYALEDWQPLLEQAERIIFLPDRRDCFLDDLLTWIVPFYQTHQIYVYVKSQESPFSVSESFAKACLEKLNLSPLSITFVADTDPSPGIRYVDMLERVYTQDSCVIAKGLWNYFSLFRSNFPFIFSLNNKEDIARGILQTAYSPEQPESLKASVGYQVRPFPQHVSLTGQDFCAVSLEAFLQNQGPKTRATFFKRKHEKEKHLNIWREHVQHYSGFFTIDSTKQQVTRLEKPDNYSVYLQGIRFDSKNCILVPQRFDHLISADTLSLEEPAFLTNFSYFFTENLRQEYNKRVPAAEAIPTVDFPFDYMLETRDGELYETVPLYRKGYVGSGYDGSLFIGYLSPKQITCTIGGQSFIIPQQAINPGVRKDFSFDTETAISQDVPVYLCTPAYPQDRIGERRFNIVVINDTIIHIGHKKDVALPPVGVVLSLHPTLFENSPLKIQTGGKIRWQVEFCEEGRLQKSQLRWLYGGYNLLMLKGENLVETPQQLETTFRREGWYLPQSMRTQETQLQNLSRQPRILLGTTEQGKIFLLTISGRIQISRGANHIESVLYSQHLLQRDGDRPCNLINLDGGASVFLEAVEAGQRHILNFPAPSDLNPAGIIRPNSAFLKILRQRE